VITGARVAITAPGRLFGPHAPLLMFAGGATTDRGAELRPLTWPDSELAAAERDGPTRLNGSKDSSVRSSLRHRPRACHR